MNRPTSIVAHRAEGSGSGPARWPHLDSLRGIAALLVVCHHAHFECSMASPLGRATAWMREGHFLVTFFIILSGYCLSLPTLETGRLGRGFLDYLRRRVWRLLPAYYAALIGSLLLIVSVEGMGRSTGRHWDFALPVTSGSIVTHALLVHNYQPEHLYQINHVFWSIAVEWQIYFAFPILLRIRRSVGALGTTALALALGMAGSVALDGTRHFGLMPHYYGMFAMGMLAADLAHASRWLEAREAVSWWTLAGLAIVATFAMGPTSSYAVLDLPFAVACLAALVALARPGRLQTWLERPAWVALGGFSYSLYLVHAPIQHLIVDRVFGRVGLGEWLEFPILLVAGTPLILAVAYGFHRLFERPFLPTRAHRTPHAPMGLGRRRSRVGTTGGQGPADSIEPGSNSTSSRVR